METRTTLVGKEIAVYARFSSDKQRDTSIDDQVRLCREYIERERGKLSKDLIFSDKAISGTVVARDGFDRLCRMVRDRAVAVVVTESGDRLSRDIGDADRLWKLCEFQGVRLICVSDGVDSARDGSEMTYAFKSVISQAYVRELGKKTLRGLRGQFDRGRSTGGLPYGYQSAPIGDPRDPEGYEIQIDADRSKIVIRIFESYAAGASYLSVASDLNRDNIDPPRVGSKSTREKMWRKESVRSILQNRTYLGEFSFGRKQWRKDPITRKRRYVLRDESDVQTDHRPDLAIVTPDLFEAVQSRKRTVGVNAKGRRGASGRKTSHPFSGLLFCHSCGSHMVFVGGGTKNYYLCNAARSAGTCGNKSLVREDFLIDHAIVELRRILSSEELWNSIRADMEADLRALHTNSGSERAQVQRDVARYSSEISRLVSFVASTDDADAVEPVRAKLAEVTRAKKEAEGRLSAFATSVTEAPALPTMAEAIGFASEIGENMAHDPTGFREFMRAEFLDGGRMVMEPLPTGGYRAHSAILPMALTGTQQRKTPENLSASGASSTQLVPVGCGGWI
jgi:site-specific DNA recombinase